MTILDGRPNTALLVIDVQNDILAAADGRGEVIANIGGLLATARAEGVPSSGCSTPMTGCCPSAARAGSSCLTWAYTSAPGRTAEAVTARDVSFTPG